MKLTDVQVDGFGVWSGLTLDESVAALHRFLRAQRSGQNDAAAVFARGAVRIFAGTALALFASACAAGPPAERCRSPFPTKDC